MIIWDPRRSSPLMSTLVNVTCPESVKLTPNVIFHNESSFCIVANLFYNQVTDFFIHSLNSLTQRSVNEEIISPKQFAAAMVENYFAIKKHFESLLPIHWLFQSKVSRKRFSSCWGLNLMNCEESLKWEKSDEGENVEAELKTLCRKKVLCFDDADFNKCFLVPSRFNFPPTTVEDFVRSKTCSFAVSTFSFDLGRKRIQTFPLWFLVMFSRSESGKVFE